MASKLIVNEIEHTDGSGTAVTMAKATIADATLTSATLTGGTIGSTVTGTLGSGVTGGSGLDAVSGDMKYMGKKVVSSSTASSDFVHNVAITGGTPDFSSTYCAHLFIVENYRPATDGGQMRAWYSDDTGTSFETTGYDGFSEHGNADNDTNLQATDSFRMGTSIQGGSYATEGWSGHCWLHGASVTDSSLWNFDGMWQTGSSNFYAIKGWFWSHSPTNGVAIDGIRFGFHSGNINTGTVRMYGLKA